MKSKNPEIFLKINQKIQNLLGQDFYLLGEWTSRFEEDFSRYSKASHCIGVSSGTSALQLLLKSLDLPVGSGIMVTSFCPIPTIMSILEVGHVPVFVDIEKDTLNISPRTLHEAYNSSCRAVLAVHIFGKLAPMLEISRWAESKSMFVLEDACQAVGSYSNSSTIAQHSWGAAMSFYPTKNLGAWGDAGAVLTNSSACKTRICELRNYGLDESFQSRGTGGNYRMDEIQALVLDEKLAFMNEFHNQRMTLVSQYRNLLPKEGFQPVELGEFHNHHVFSFLLDNAMQREQYREFCKLHKLRANFFYEKPIYKSEGLKHHACKDLEGVSDVCSRIINLPLNEPQLTEEVCKFLNSILS